MPFLKPLHIAVGIIGLIVFVLTGQYMAIFLKGLADMADGPRLLYRSAHLYLMWSSLVNVLVGFYFVTAATKGARIGQVAASVLLLAGPLLILAGFFIESPINNLDRAYTGWANYFALGGVLIHVVASRHSRSAG